MKTIVVYYEDTNEVIATIPLGEYHTGFMMKDVEYKVFDGVEPVFEPPTEEYGIRLKLNTYIIDLNEGRGGKDV